jgi:hypothetical protein
LRTLKSRARSREARHSAARLNIGVSSCLRNGVIPSVAVLQAKRGISRYEAVCQRRFLGPLVKTRTLREDAA